MVKADDAQAKFGKGRDVVAIIDTGVDPMHAALRDVLVPGYDFTRDRSDTVSEWSDVDPATAAALQQSTVEILDTTRPAVVLNATTVAILSQSTVEILDGVGLPKAFGHGTMTAGLVHRIAPEAKIMPLKAFRADGTASLSDIVRAIRYAVDHGATVINMSFSFPSPSAELQSAVEYANTRGVICVASAGNNGRETSTYPAAFKQVIGVGSTNFSDRRSAFSNWGGSTRTSAPGEALVTTYPGNTYAGVWGTSFSTALVSGAVTLFQQNTSRCGYSAMKSALDYGLPIEQDMGDGRLELILSINYLRNR
jgi:subtilisin family serine protease